MKSNAAVGRTADGLAEAMFDELDALHNGQSTPQQARAKSSIANTIIQINRLKMDFARFVTDARTGESKEQPALPNFNMGLVSAK